MIKMFLYDFFLDILSSVDLNWRNLRCEMTTPDSIVNVW